jgi:hypothetical protein
MVIKSLLLHHLSLIYLSEYYRSSILLLLLNVSSFELGRFSWLFRRVPFSSCNAIKFIATLNTAIADQYHGLFRVYQQPT